MEQSEVASNPQTPIDSVSIDDHSSNKKSRGGKPKLFQCTGYGDCRMVFTRSEHLARHMRKHTGEKPFKCVVPGCNRMFSRFDNMMQHTQTHNKARSTSRGPKNEIGKSKDRRSSENSLSDADSNYDQSGLPSPPPSRRSTKDKILYNARIRQKRQLQRKNYAENYDDEDIDEDDEDDDDMDELEYDDSEDDTGFHNGKHDYSDDSDSDTSYSMYGYYADYRDGRNGIAEQRAMFAEMRRSSHDGYTLPPPIPNSHLNWSNNSSVHLSKSMIDNDSIWTLPSIQAPIPLVPGSSSSHHHHHRTYPLQRHSESPMSLSSASVTTDSSNTPCKRQRMTPKVQFHPYPYRRHSTTADGRYVLRPLYQKQGDRDEHSQGDDTHMILPRIATYLMAHPDEPPENYLLHHQCQQQSDNQHSPLHQKRAMTWPTLPGTEKIMTRRLSVQDLCNPIECLEQQSSVAINKNGACHDGSCKSVNNTEQDTVSVKQEDGVDLTLDEYEAIQGFGRFQKCGTLK